MAVIELIGVPFDGYGRPGNQTLAAARLRAAGIADAFTGHQLHEGADGGDIALPPPDPGRAAGSGIVNQAALLAMIDTLNRRVRAAVDAGRFPVLYGGDCSVLLGAVTGLRDAQGRAGLLHVDGHEDTTPLDVIKDGEAANMEIGLLLGLTGTFAPAPLRRRLPALGQDALALLGLRDEGFRRQFNMGSLRDLGVPVRGFQEIAADPALAGREAVEHVRRAAPGWWLHMDLDVLDPEVFVAQGPPAGFEDEPGGLTWEQLTGLVTAALGAGGCRGMSLAIYDPEHDPDGADAARIVRIVRDIARSLP